MAQVQTLEQTSAPQQVDVHHHVVIVGGGTGGICVAARLSKTLPPSQIAIIEPSSKHYYQPLWTLVGGGVFPKEASERDEAAYIPNGSVWMQDAVSVRYVVSAERTPQKLSYLRQQREASLAQPDTLQKDRQGRRHARPQCPVLAAALPPSP